MSESTLDRTGEAPDAPDVPETPVRAWLSLLAVALGVMVVQVDGTVVAAANPAIAEDLGASPTGIQWVTTAYLLVLAGLLIPAGTIADKLGRKSVFLVGVGGFSLASLLCGMAGSVETLIGARVVQGVFASFLAVAGLAVVRAAFPPEKLGAAFGWFGAASAVATAGGPMLGGVLVDYASWPWVFFINLPLGVVAVAVGWFVIRETTERQSHPLDLPGAVILTAAMVSVVWAINGVQEHGWTSANTLGFLAAGAVLLGVFIVVERRSEHPMVPLELFGNRTFTVGIAAMAVTMFAFFAIVFYLMFYLQGVQEKSAVMAAVALLPLTAVFTVSSPLAGWLTTRVGVRSTLVLGAGLITAGLLLLLRIDIDSGVLALTPSMLLAGFGAGFMIVPAMHAVIGSAPVDKAGVASGVQQSMQQLGSTLGIAVFGTVLASVVTARFADAVDDAFAGADGSTAGALATDEQLEQAVALGFAPSAQDQLGQQLEQGGMPSGRAGTFTDTLTQAAHETFIDGMHTVFVVAAAVVVVAGLLALLIREPEPAAADEAAY